jgi:hypothetical protein
MISDSGLASAGGRATAAVAGVADKTIGLSAATANKRRRIFNLFSVMDSEIPAFRHACGQNPIKRTQRNET